jgi:hypothetical protein
VFVEEGRGGVIQATTLIARTLTMCTNLDVFRQCLFFLVNVGWGGGEALETEEGKVTGSKLAQVT